MKDILGREEVLTLENAKELLFKSVNFKLLPEVEIEINNSLNKVLSQAIISPEDLPDFTRSTMDGFAVNSFDTFGATEGLPAYLNITGEVLMGKQPALEVKKGETARIATGGMLPIGTDAVVMLEHTNLVSEKLVEVLKPVSPEENTIQKGEDCKRNEVVLNKGHRIRPQDIGVLAGIGITEIWTYEKPKVAIITTGDEIVPASHPLMPGQVRDSTGKPGILFHGVSIKPGKPMIGGIVNGKPVFGLPGHPAAVIVCFEVFVKPVLRILSGETEKLHHRLKKTIKAKLSKNISSSAGREDYIRVFLEEKNGELWATPISGKSGLITTIVKAEGTIIIPLRKAGLEQGTEIEVELFKMVYDS